MLLPYLLSRWYTPLFNVSAVEIVPTGTVAFKFITKLKVSQVQALASTVTALCIQAEGAVIVTLNPLPRPNKFLNNWIR